MVLTAQDLITIRDAATQLEDHHPDLSWDLHEVGDKLGDELKAILDTPYPRRVYELEDRVLEVVLTYEGVIMDAYQLDPDGNDLHVGTIGMMADEWWEHIDGK